MIVTLMFHPCDGSHEIRIEDKDEAKTARCAKLALEIVTAEMGPPNSYESPVFYYRANGGKHLAYVAFPGKPDEVDPIKMLKVLHEVTIKSNTSEG